MTEWSAFEKEAESLRTEHRLKTLPDLVLPDDMEFTSDLERAMKEKDLLVVAVPSIYVRETARKMKPFLKEGQLVVNVAKGIEEATLMTLTDILEEELPGADVAVLSGPSHAEEVSRGLPTTCVAGAKTRKTAEKIQNIFMSPVFRVYISPDILGIEIGGALKNVIALAAGIADGLGYGDNTKAALITRGVAEISPAWHGHGRKAGNLCRSYRDRRPDRNLCQHAQPQPPCRNPDRKRLFHEGGHGRGSDGGRGRLFCQGRSGSCQKVSGVHADHRGSQ